MVADAGANFISKSGTGAKSPHTPERLFREYFFQKRSFEEGKMGRDCQGKAFRVGVPV